MKTLYALNEFERKREEKERKINFLQTKSSGSQQLEGIGEQRKFSVEKYEDEAFIENMDNFLMQEIVVKYRNIGQTMSFINHSMDEKEEKQPGS